MRFVLIGFIISLILEGILIFFHPETPGWAKSMFGFIIYVMIAQKGFK